MIKKTQLFELNPQRMPSDWRYRNSHLYDRFVLNPYGRSRQFELHYYYEDNHQSSWRYAWGCFDWDDKRLCLCIKQEFELTLGDSIVSSLWGEQAQTLSEQPRTLEGYFTNPKRTSLYIPKPDDEELRYYKRQNNAKDLALFYRYNETLKADLRRHFSAEQMQQIPIPALD